MADPEIPKTKVCPNCGAVVPRREKQCPVCGQLLATGHNLKWLKELGPVEIFLLVLGSIMLAIGFVAF